ncbi:MAG: ribbon-helix-helix domain-containing protein [Xenococcus sp. (in: cyanobacteria)]
MKEKNKKKDHLFKGTGMGVTHKQPPVSVKLPPEIDKIVRSLPNRSDYIRQAIIEKLDREGLLNGIKAN